MDNWDQNIFEELIADTRFVEWASGKNSAEREYWNSWPTRNPDHKNEFGEALKMVKSLRFRGAAGLSEYDVAYSWAKTAGKINRAERGSKWRVLVASVTKVAAVLLLPVLIFSGWLILNQHNLSKKYANLLGNKQAQSLTVVAPFCARTVVDLPDGSKVWLNAGSELTYPVVFATNERRVHLTGEAYFKVSKDEVPFFVSNLGPEIKVYGTEFNVNSYSNEELVTVALAEGKVSLVNGENEEYIKPGQVSSFNRHTKKITVENTDVNNYSCWREGKYVFRDTSLSAIMRILQRQYNVAINLLDPQLGNYRYNMTIKNENLEQILQLLSFSAPIKCSYKPRTFQPDGTYVPDKVDISIDKTRIIKN